MSAKRDEHVINTDFLDSSIHPEIRFTATNATPTGSGFEVTGSLSVKVHIAGPFPVDRTAGQRLSHEPLRF